MVESEKPSAKGDPSVGRLLVFMFTDLVDSSALARQLGDSDYVRHVLEPHNAIFRRVLAQFPQAQEIKHTGDGFMATFASASDAAHSALHFHHALRTATWQRVTPRTRIGIHLGEAIDFAGSDGARKDLAGDAANMTARVMSLAEPEQTLITKAAFDSARQSGRVLPPVVGNPTHSQSGAAEPAERETSKPEVRWLAHGHYSLKGAEDPIEVFEVGLVGESPLRAPADSEKARRTVSVEEAALLGWRPAPGLEVPGREQWLVDHKLGDGGFGEVWLVRQQRTKQARAFKLCFDAQRLRSFKRELTLFRLIQEALGNREDIVQLIDIRLDKPPFYLESEYLPSGNLQQWVENRGGLHQIPLARRLDLLAQVARTIGAVHSLGIIHKDIKPSNIFIREFPGAIVRPMLADFGIGALTDLILLEAHGITVTGFTQTLVGADSSRTGTRLYMPTESIVGKPATTARDVYALGILLYQLVVGDFNRPLTSDWREDIEDDLLREDISSCVVGDPLRRIQSALMLAERLEGLAKRRSQQSEQRRESPATRAVQAFLDTIAYFNARRGFMDRDEVQGDFGVQQSEVFALLERVASALTYFCSVALSDIADNALEQLADVRDYKYFVNYYYPPAALDETKEFCLSMEGLRRTAAAELVRRRQLSNQYAN